MNKETASKILENFITELNNCNTNANLETWKTKVSNNLDRIFGASFDKKRQQIKSIKPTIPSSYSFNNPSHNKRNVEQINKERLENLQTAKDKAKEFIEGYVQEVNDYELELSSSEKLIEQLKEKNTEYKDKITKQRDENIRKLVEKDGLIKEYKDKNKEYEGEIIKQKNEKTRDLLEKDRLIKVSKDKVKELEVKIKKKYKHDVGFWSFILALILAVSALSYYFGGLRYDSSKLKLEQRSDSLSTQNKMLRGDTLKLRSNISKLNKTIKLKDSLLLEQKKLISFPIKKEK